MCIRDRTTTASGVRSTDRACVHAVAASTCPSVSIRFSREFGASSATRSTSQASTCPGGSPRRSRCRASAHSRAESVGASRLSSSVTGRVAASPASESGQPATTPLWLNSHGPSVNGAHAVSTTGMPIVPERTAASTAPEEITRASRGRSASAQIGTVRRYRAGSGWPGAYQPTPKPSALMVPPPRMSAGAQDWRSSECGWFSSRSARGTGGPR